MRRISTFAAGVVCCALTAQTPERNSHPLSLQDSLRTALENNLQVQIARESRASVDAGVSIAQGAFDWNLTSGFTYAYQDSALTKSLYPTGPLARTEATTRSRSFAIGVQKPFEWGGNLQINYSQAYAFSGGDYRDPDTGSLLGRLGTRYPYSGAFSGTYSQSLLKGFGRSANEVQVIVARKTSQAAEQQFTLAIINLMVTAETQYWDLVYASRNLENAQASLSLAQKQLEDNKTKARAGTLPEIEVTSAEAAVAYRKQTLILAQSQLRIANDALLRTLFPRSARTERIVPTDTPDLTFTLPEPDRAEKAALERRVELKIARLAKDSTRALRVAAENRLLPQLNAFMTYNATSDNLTGLGAVNSDLFGASYPGYAVGLNFAFPIGNRAAKGSLAQARAQERGSELAIRDLELGILLQVRQALESVEAAQEGVHAAQLTHRLRAEDLQAEQKKFENGMSTTFLVLSKQNDLDTSIAAELQAQIGNAKAVTALEQATGNLLEARGFSGVR